LYTATTTMRPVRFTSSPPAIAWVGKEYAYNLTTIDEDGDIPIFSIISAPSRMTLGPSTGKLRWTPATSDIGNSTISVRVADGRGSTDNQTFTVTVQDIPVPPVFSPKCAITYPANGITVRGAIQIHGSATNGSLPLSAVKMRLDGGEWSPVVGLENWVFTVDTVKLVNGHHRIEAKAFAANISSETASVNFTVQNPGPEVSLDNDPWCLPAIVIAAIAAVAFLILLRKKRD
jgi:hypothetical protein